MGRLRRALMRGVVPLTICAIAVLGGGDPPHILVGSPVLVAAAIVLDWRGQAHSRVAMEAMLIAAVLVFLVGLAGALVLDGVWLQHALSTVLVLAPLSLVGAGVVVRWRAMNVPTMALLGGIAVLLSMVAVLLGTHIPLAWVVVGLGVLAGLVASLAVLPTAGDMV